MRDRLWVRKHACLRHRRKTVIASVLFDRAGNWAAAPRPGAPFGVGPDSRTCWNEDKVRRREGSEAAQPHGLWPADHCKRVRARNRRKPRRHCTDEKRTCPWNGQHRACPARRCARRQGAGAASWPVGARPVTARRTFSAPASMMSKSLHSACRWLRPSMNVSANDADVVRGCVEQVFGELVERPLHLVAGVGRVFAEVDKDHVLQVLRCLILQHDEVPLNRNHVRSLFRAPAPSPVQSKIRLADSSSKLTIFFSRTGHGPGEPP